jgi:hypothetical protein
MPLTSDPSREIYVALFVGVKFAMFDQQKRVICQVSWEGLRERAARDNTDQDDLRGTFEKHRATIERAASDLYDRGERNPLVQFAQF